MIQSSYKTHDGALRTMVSENNFVSGMYYTDTPLAEGQNKMIMNFQLANNGATLKPRPGYQTYEALTGLAVVEADKDCIVHHTTQMYMSKQNSDDVVLCRYYLAGSVYETTSDERAVGMPNTLFDLQTAKLSAVYDGKNIYNSAVPTITPSKDVAKYYLSLMPSHTNIHGCDIKVGHSRTGVFTSMDNNTYVILFRRWTEGNFIKWDSFVALLKAEINTTGESLTFSITQLSPNSITAVQAVNYGYNMLLPDPYTFEIKQTATGGLLLDGILPYDSDGKLMTSARLGTELTFKLIYRYPKIDVDNGKAYYVQWEVQDLSTNADPVIVQRVRDSRTYQPGDEISITTRQATYKQFTISAKVYYKDEVDSTTYPDSDVSTDINDQIYLKPIQVVTLAYYYLSEESNSTTTNLSAVNYDLSTAQGMCVWQQRIVLWGVKGAKNTLWVSEINDPSWFPYPNNCEIFADDIVACTKYKTNLLVFTKTALYQLAFQEDGLSYTTTCIQERLTMEEEDASSIIPVQSMVFFKNGNYYYLVVPVTGSMTGELQLAPITRPIEYCMDNFKDFTDDTLGMLLNPKNLDNYLTNELYDWWCILEQRTLRIYYKMQCVIPEGSTYVDLVFNYDTTARTWTMTSYNSTAYRMVPYIPSVTAETIFVMPQRSSPLGVNLNLIRAVVTDPADDFPLDYGADRVLQNVQYLDTGYRNIEADLKKRFRQIQLRVTNPYSKPLVFRTQFRVDNDLRKMLYNTEVTEITDPDAPDYGSVYVDYILEDADLVEGMDKVDRLHEEWGIDPRRFPDLTTAMIKLNVQGKGRLGRLILQSSNHMPGTDALGSPVLYDQAMYEISNVVWIYRVMNGR